MKTNFARMAVFGVAVATMAIPAFAGQTQVERERVLRESADPESEVAQLIRPAQETGSLLAGKAKQLESEGVAKAEVPTVEIGGRVYRIGIDTGP